MTPVGTKTAKTPRGQCRQRSGVADCGASPIERCDSYVKEPGSRRNDLTGTVDCPILAKTNGLHPMPKWRNGIRGGLKNHWRLLHVGSNPTFGILAYAITPPSDGVCPIVQQMDGVDKQERQFDARPKWGDALRQQVRLQSAARGRGPCRCRGHVQSVRLGRRHPDPQNRAPLFVGATSEWEP